jgi:amino acid transporter
MYSDQHVHLNYVLMTDLLIAMPTAGGVYYWCFKLADQNWGPFAAWMAGYTYLVGLLAVNMTLAYGGAQFIIGMIAMGEGTYPQGAYVGIYVGLLILAALVNLLGTGATGIINKFIGKILTTFINRSIKNPLY